MKCKVLLFCLFAALTVQSPAQAMRKTSIPKHLGVPGIETGVLLTILAILGPAAREALRKVETSFSTFLAQLKESAENGGMEWRDALEVVDVLPYPEFRPRSTYPVAFAGGIVAVDPKKARLVLVDKQTKEIQPIDVGLNPGQPVVGNNRLYITSNRGLHIFDEKWRMTLIEAENALEPVLHGRWVFFPIALPGRVMILDATIGHACVSQIVLDGSIAQILVAVERKQLHIPVVTPDWGKVTMVLDIAGYDANDAGDALASPIDQEKFFRHLGPNGREALRSVTHYYNKWLIDMQSPAPRGFGWWCDSMVLHFEDAPIMDLNRALVVGEVLYAPNENGLVAYDARKREMRAHALVDEASKPELIDGNICVRVKDGVKVFGPRLNLIGTFVGADLDFPVAADNLYFLAQPSNPGIIHRGPPEMIVDQIEVRAHPGRPIVHNGRLYVPHRNSEYFTVIDVVTFTVLCSMKAANLVPSVKQYLFRETPKLEVNGCYFELESAGTNSRLLVKDPGSDKNGTPTVVRVIDIPGAARHLLRVNNQVGLNEIWVPYSTDGKNRVLRIDLKGWY